METTAKPAEDVAYDDDYHAWCLQQVKRMGACARPGTNDGLDYENLAEEIESLGRSDRCAIKSLMRVLLADLLKWCFQPERQGPGREGSIFNARTEIADLVSESLSLVRYSREVIAEAYVLAVRGVARETGIAVRDLPVTCPFAEAEIFDSQIMP